MWSFMRSSFRRKDGEFPQKWSLLKSSFTLNFVNINHCNIVLCFRISSFLEFFSQCTETKNAGHHMHTHPHTYTRKIRWKYEECA